MVYSAFILASGLYSNRVRELCDPDSFRGQRNRAGTLGYRRPRRVRPSATTQLPRERRYSDRLLCRLPNKSRKCSGQGKSNELKCLH